MELDGALEIGRGAIVLAQLGVDPAEVHKAHGVVGLEADGCFEGFNGEGIAALSRVGRGQHVVEVGVCGVEG